MYAKLVENQLQIAGSVIKGQDETGYWSIANPNEEQLRAKGYKNLITLPEPAYDNENEKLTTKYIETETDITVDYDITTLTDEEHNAIIIQQIVEEEKKITDRNYREAIKDLKEKKEDSYALDKIDEIEANIQALRAKLRETEKGE
ncbi:MAG: hypothetical protein IJK26_05690 [Clostridia bacterium]|nr:hypothetical protein [Clostridia bacterium]